MMSKADNPTQQPTNGARDAIDAKSGSTPLPPAQQLVTARERQWARRLSATLLPHTTSVHNVEIIAAALAHARHFWCDYEEDDSSADKPSPETPDCEHDWIADPMSGIRVCAHCRQDQPVEAINAMSERVDQTASQSTEKPPSQRYREFAQAFLALHFDSESGPFKGGVEILCRALEQAREEGYQEGYRQAEAYPNV